MGLQADVWIVAGAPGAGKSTVAGSMLTLLDPTPALLDKDTLFSGFVAEVLRAHDRPHGEREGRWYDDHIKSHEYGGLTAASREIRSAGCPVLLVAPFTQQIRDPARWSRWVDELGGDTVHLVWVSCDPESLRQRMLGRGRSRDAGKLADFAAFVERMRPAQPPPVPHVAIDNGAGAPSVTSQLTQGLRDLVVASASADR